MELLTCLYQTDKGWNEQPDTSLDSENTLLIFFATPHIDEVQEIINNLQKQFSQSVILGCSSSGEIFQDELFDHSLSLAIIRFKHTQIKLISTIQSNAADSVKSGKKIAKSLDSAKLRSVFILSEGLSVNGSQLLRGINSVLAHNIIITGGLAGDGDNFSSTWVYANNKASNGQIAAVGFYGNKLGVAHGSRGGWDRLGPDREVTRSTNNILYELDGLPALSVYKKYLGERAEGLPATGLLFPLAIRNEDEADGTTVRTILAVDESSQSITFAGDIPEGSFVQLMTANFDRLIDGASQAGEQTDIKSASGEILSIAISCVGRRLVLGQRTEEEIEAALDSLSDNTKQIGFYSYGEISPLATGRCDLHNQTMTITTLWEQV